MRTPTAMVTTAAAVLVLGAVLAACSSSSSSSTPAGTASATVPSIAAGDFTADFAVMQQLKDLAASGTGMIGVLLPDTTTSTRYVQYDLPLLTKAFQAAGLSSDQFKIDNAQGSTQTMQSQAEAQGVKVIDYDRLVSGGPADRYYVSFNNVQVGNLIGKGEVDCISAWKVSNPNILIMNGDPTDNNAKLFAQGYHEVLDPHFSDGSYTKVGEPAGTWTPSVAQTTFEQQFTAHPNITD